MFVDGARRTVQSRRDLLVAHTPRDFVVPHLDGGLDHLELAGGESRPDIPALGGVPADLPDRDADRLGHLVDRPSEQVVRADERRLQAAALREHDRRINH